MKTREVAKELPKAPRSSEGRGVEARDLRRGNSHTVAHKILEMFLHRPSILEQEPNLVVAKDQARVVHDEMERKKENATGASQPQSAPRGPGDG
jgi:hypothetical protein